MYDTPEHTFLHIPSNHKIKIDDEFSCDYNQLLSSSRPFDGRDYGRQILHEYQYDSNLDMIAWDIEDDLQQAFMLEHNVNLSETTEQQIGELLEQVSRQLFEQTSLQQQTSKRPQSSPMLLAKLADYELKKNRKSVEAMSTGGVSYLSQDSGIEDAYPSDTDDRDGNSETNNELVEIFLITELETVEVHSDENASPVKEERCDSGASSDRNNNRAQSVLNQTLENTIAKHKQEREKIKVFYLFISVLIFFFF